MPIVIIIKKITTAYKNVCSSFFHNMRMSCFSSTHLPKGPTPTHNRSFLPISFFVQR